MRFTGWAILAFKFAIGLAWLLAMTGALNAQVHIRDGGTGDGTAWNNALDDLPASFTRGTTYYVADGTYGGHTFTDAESGTDVITIKKATVAEHGTATGWDNSYGDGTATFTGGFIVEDDYYTFDGATRNESNWKTNQYGFRGPSVSCDSIAFGSAGSHVIVRYWELGDTYSETYYSDMNAESLKVAYAQTDWTISHCWLHNSVETIFQLAGLTGGVIEYNFIGPSWGKVAIRGAATASDITIRYNQFYNACQTDPDDETSGLTAEIGMWDYGSTQSGVKIYGNTFYSQVTGNRNASILVGGDADGWAGPGSDGTMVYNNTFAGIVESSIYPMITLNGANTVARNNFFYDCADEDVGADTVSDNDVAGADPFVNYGALNFHLSVATVAGTTLGSPYNTDMDGVTRGWDGTWDVGAFEYGSAPAVTNVVTFDLLIVGP